MKEEFFVRLGTKLITKHTWSVTIDVVQLGVGVVLIISTMITLGKEAAMSQLHNEVGRGGVGLKGKVEYHHMKHYQ